MAVRKKKPGGQTPSKKKELDIRRGLFNDAGTVEETHKYRIDRWQFIIYVGADPDSNMTGGDEPGVDHNMANRFETNLNILSGIDPHRPILVVMANPGGLVHKGMQMVGAALACSNPMTALTLESCSMGSIFPLAFDRFLIRPPAEYMIHRGYSAPEGTDQEVDSFDIERRKWQALMPLIYTTRLKEQGVYSHLPEDEIERIVRREMLEKGDVWKSADQAVLEGYADGVYLGDTENLRATEKNLARRARMLETIRSEITVDIKVSVKKRGVMP